MKILKLGDADRNWRATVECGTHDLRGTGCGATLLVSFTDLSYRPAFYSAHSDMVTFKCPCCGTENKLATDLWPKSYKRLNKNYYDLI